VDARTLRDIANVSDPVERARAASAAMAGLQGQSVELSRIRRGAIVEAREGGMRKDAPVHALETICAASRHTFPIGQAVGGDQF
jgi:hypothetical protein